MDAGEANAYGLRAGAFKWSVLPYTKELEAELEELAGQIANAQARFQKIIEANRVGPTDAGFQRLLDADPEAVRG